MTQFEKWKPKVVNVETKADGFTFSQEFQIGKILTPYIQYMRGGEEKEIKGKLAII